MIKVGDYLMKQYGLSLLWRVTEIYESAPGIFAVGVIRVKPTGISFGKVKYLAMSKGMGSPYGTINITKEQLSKTHSYSSLVPEW